jgi:hypothetical protein
MPLSPSPLWSTTIENERCAYHPARHAAGRYSGKLLCTSCALSLRAVVRPGRASG